MRDWPGPDPLRVVLDKNLCLPPTHHVLDGNQPTLFYTYRQRADTENRTYATLSEADDLMPQILADLWQRQVQSVLVEGGPTVLNALLHAGLWDEIRVFRSAKKLGDGAAAPRLGLSGLQSAENVGEDELFRYVNK